MYRFPILALIIGSGLLAVVLASADNTPTSVFIRPAALSCELYFSAKAEYRQGGLTNRGHTPGSFFHDLRSPDGSARYVVLMGPPGSGKTQWSREAERRGWVVVNTDKIRQEAIVQYKNSGGKIQVQKIIDGQEITVDEVPDPSNPDHLFSKRFQYGAFEIAEQQIQSALSQGKSVVDDKTNANLFRVKSIVNARRAGYFVEGLVFYSPDVSRNLSNIRRREREGGIPVREQITKNIYRSFLFYSGKLQLNPRYRSTRNQQMPELTPKFQIEMADRYKTLDDAIKKAELAHSLVLRAYRSEDVFNRIEVVLTADWGRQVP